MVVSDAGLVAANTGADIVKPSGLCLVRHLRVGNQGPGHAAHIRLTVRKHLFGQLWLVNAPGNEDGLMYIAFNDACMGSGIGVINKHRRHHMNRACQSHHGADCYVQEVEFCFLVQATAYIEPGSLVQSIGL